MHLKGDDVMEALLLKVADNEPGVSPFLSEEATLLNKDPTPRRFRRLPHTLLTTWRRPQAQMYSWIGGPSGCKRADTTAASRVWTAHPNVWPVSLGRFRAPSQHSQRSPAGYNLSGLHGDD